MDEQKLHQMIQHEIENYMSRKQYTLSRIPNHTHNGVDCVRINPADLLGFPTVSVIPTDKARNGTIRVYNSGATYRLYVRINNLWKYASLT